MSRRIYIGNQGGSFVARMAKPGFDAITADVNNRRQISFASDRATFGQQAEAGTIGAPDTWVNFGIAYAGIPCVVAALRNGAGTYNSPVRHYTIASGDTVDATAFVLAVEQGRILATAPSKIHQGYQPGDFYNFFSVK